MEALGAIGNFIISSKAEIFALIGVLIGGLISYASSSKAAKIAEKTQLRNERIAIVKEVGDLLRISQEKTYAVQSLIPYYSDSDDYQTHMKKALTSADRAASQLSRYHQTNRFFLPKDVDVIFSKLVGLDIRLLLMDGRHLIRTNREQWVKIYKERDDTNNKLTDALRSLVGSNK